MTLQVEDRVSKNGKAYCVLVIAFDNGYKYESFLTNEQTFCIKSALDRKEK